MVEIKYEIKNIALSASNQQNKKSKPLYKNKLRNMQDKHYKFRKEHRDNFSWHAIKHQNWKFHMSLKMGIRCCIQHETICLPAVFYMINIFIFSHVFEKAMLLIFLLCLYRLPLKLLSIQPPACSSQIKYEIIK